jgi:hypothetical protein
MVANTVVKWQWVDDGTARDVDDVDERLDIRVDDTVGVLGVAKYANSVTNDVRRYVEPYFERIECE